MRAFDDDATMLSPISYVNVKIHDSEVEESIILGCGPCADGLSNVLFHIMRMRWLYNHKQTFSIIQHMSCMTIIVIFVTPNQISS